MKNTFTATLLLVVAATSLQAATVLIDFGTVALTTNPDSNSNKWNSITAPGTTSGLVNSSNVSTGISITVTTTGTASTGFGGTGVNGPIGATAPFNTTGTAADRPTGDGLFVNVAGDIITLSFSGLAANTPYDFSAIGGRASNGTDGSIAVTTGTGTAGNLLNNGTILNYTVTSNALGQIAFTFTEAPNTLPAGANATFNALSITQAVPEPSVAFFGAIGLLGLMRRRRI